MTIPLRQLFDFIVDVSIKDDAADGVLDDVGMDSVLEVYPTLVVHSFPPLFSQIRGRGATPT
mgnify:CR=1 FL=1